MMEQPITQTQVQPKATNTVYMREYQRKNRIKNKKCSCGEQAYAKILLTQEYKCAKHLVAPLKEELLKEKK